MTSGYETTEFWLSTAASVIGALLSGGVLGTGSQVERVAGIAALVLSALGYGAGRSKIKAGGKAP